MPAVPYNGPVCVGMVLATSTWAIALGNWINQSQNALVNYCNRNASSPTSTATLVRSYCGAVGASLVVGVGLASFIKSRWPPYVDARTHVPRSIPCGIMRAFLLSQAHRGAHTIHVLR